MAPDQPRFNRQPTRYQLSHCVSHSKQARKLKALMTQSTSEEPLFGADDERLAAEDIFRQPSERWSPECHIGPCDRWSDTLTVPSCHAVLITQAQQFAIYCLDSSTALKGHVRDEVAPGHCAIKRHIEPAMHAQPPTTHQEAQQLHPSTNAPKQAFDISPQLPLENPHTSKRDLSTWRAHSKAAAAWVKSTISNSARPMWQSTQPVAYCTWLSRLSTSIASCNGQVYVRTHVV